MPKIAIIPLSLYLNNKPQLTVNAFRVLGVSQLSIWWHYLSLPKFLEKWRGGPALPQIFEQFRKGELTISQLRDIIRSRFPKANLTDESFDQAWNKMQLVTPITKNALSQIEELENNGYTTYLLAGTNQLHHEDALKKCERQEFPGTRFFSYEQKKLGKDLFSTLIQKIHQENPGIDSQDIVFFYTPPKHPFPRLGWLRWLNIFGVVQNYEYSEAQKYVNGLVAESKKLQGFTLIQNVINEETHTPNIIATLKAQGWIIKEDAPSKNPSTNPVLGFSKAMTIIINPEYPAKTSALEAEPPANESSSELRQRSMTVNP